jgi:rare lipoprotein A
MRTQPPARALLRLRFDVRRNVRFHLSWLGVLICAGLLSRPVPCLADPTPETPQVGQASWYGEEFARRRTASGEQFDPQGITGAHRTLPLGSRVRVTNLHNGRSVLVTINDRGPYRYRRAIDLSYGAARILGMVRRGVAQVRIELVES